MAEQEAPVSRVLLATGANDRAWAMKRDWTDVDFQAGAEANRACLQGFEDELVARLKRSSARALGAQVGQDLDLGGGGSSSSRSGAGSGGGGGGNVLARVLEPLASTSGVPSEQVRAEVLSDPEVLGSALDIVGAYLKNYEVDRAAAVVETVLPVCRERGGLWLLKALNHLATVRMKQARPQEALTALREVESSVKANLTAEEHDEAWEFWETIYRNFGWVLSNLGDGEEAIAYIQRAIDVKERVGRSASWFDLWDLGRMKATAALKQKKPESIKASQAVVTKALWLHRDAEPSDLVMRGKIWHSVGECSFALGHLAEEAAIGSDGLCANPNGPCGCAEAKAHYRKALKCFRESHKLFKKTEGGHNPLTGSEAQAAAWSLLKLGEEEEAKTFLVDALETLSRQQSGWGDGDQLECEAPALNQAMQTVDRVLEAHRRTDDRGGLTRYFAAVERLCDAVGRRLRLSKARTDAATYEKLVSSCSMIMVASGTDDGTARSQQLLRKHMWKSPDTPQAQLCSELLLSLKNAESGPGGTGAGGGPAAEQGPGMKAFLEALARTYPDQA